MIGSAIEHGSTIFVMDENGRTLYSKAKGSGPDDGLLSFADLTMTIRLGSVICTYDENGCTLNAEAA